MKPRAIHCSEFSQNPFQVFDIFCSRMHIFDVHRYNLLNTFDLLKADGQIRSEEEEENFAQTTCDPLHGSSFSVW